MKPVFQTDTTFKTGNCGEACVASILEIELSDIPMLHNQDDPEDGATYCRNLRKFLSKFGMSFIDVSMVEDCDPMDFFKDCWVVASGKSPRATEDWQKHAVVWRNGEIVHDPHPNGSGLDEIEMYGVFIKQNPEHAFTDKTRTQIKKRGGQ